MSIAAGLAFVGQVERERDLPQEGRCEGLRTQSRVGVCRWGTLFDGLNPPVGPRLSGAMVVDGDG